MALPSLNPLLSTSRGFTIDQNLNLTSHINIIYQSRWNARNTVMSNSPPDSPKPIHHLQGTSQACDGILPTCLDGCGSNYTQEARHHPGQSSPAWLAPHPQTFTPSITDTQWQPCVLSTPSCATVIEHEVTSCKYGFMKYKHKIDTFLHNEMELRGQGEIFLPADTHKELSVQLHPSTSVDADIIWKRLFRTYLCKIMIYSRG